MSATSRRESVATALHNNVDKGRPSYPAGEQMAGPRTGTNPQGVPWALAILGSASDRHAGRVAGGDLHQSARPDYRRATERHQRPVDGRTAGTRRRDHGYRPVEPCSSASVRRRSWRPVSGKRRDT